MNNRFKLLPLLAVIAIFALPAHGQCSADGPSLDATGKYIEATSNNVAWMTASANDGKLIYGATTTPSPSGHIDNTIVQFMNIDCSQIAPAKSDNGHLYVYLFCRDKMNCVTWHAWNAQSDYWQSFPRSYASVGTESEDSQLTGNLARALQHYVFLIQAQYRQAHNSGSDPFGTPK